MRRFSASFQLDKSQGELDFVDIPIGSDLPIFIDPFAIALRPDRWSQRAHATLISFFERVIAAIRNDDAETALELLGHFREPNETRLGLSRRRPRGRGIGHLQSRELFDALGASSAVRTGLLSSLEECELLVEGIGRDKISDLTTNVIRAHLAEYTHDQCNLLGIPTREVSLGPHYSADTGQWESGYFMLPVIRNKAFLLVPKAIVRFDPAYNHQRYYRQVVLSFLQAEHLNANSSLVRTLKNGRRVVRKKDVQASFPCTKENLFRFSQQHPEALHRYRDRLVGLEQQGPTSLVDAEDEELIAEALGQALSSIPTGNVNATSYHQIMVGIVEFIFFPNLLYPRKEREIHQGRKRIDILMENGASTGIFLRLHQNRGLPCSFVAFECKNYVTDVANPELDQLSGRFSPNRGKIGFLCCRRFEDRRLFVERCRDTFRDARGLVVPLDDDTIRKFLDLIGEGRRKQIDDEVASLIDEVWVS